MKRAAIEKTRTLKVWRQHLNTHVREIVASGGQQKLMCACDLQANRFRKGQKVANCGRPNCYVCHYDKLMGIPKHRDLKLLARAAEDETSAG